MTDHILVRLVARRLYRLAPHLTSHGTVNTTFPDCSDPATPSAMRTCLRKVALPRYGILPVCSPTDLPVGSECVQVGVVIDVPFLPPFLPPTDRLSTRRIVLRGLTGPLLAIRHRRPAFLHDSRVLPHEGNVGEAAHPGACRRRRPEEELSGPACHGR